MEIKPILGKAKSFFKHYKYAIIVLVAGLFLMLLPGTNKTKTSQKETTVQTQKTSESMEERLTHLLQQINGVGEVRVLLTLENSGETIFQTDRESSVNQDDQDINLQTVIITDADRNQNGLIRKQNSPTYRGAVVVCTGGDDPNVQLAVTQAVMRSTNLNADQICVLKMK